MPSPHHERFVLASLLWASCSSPLFYELDASSESVSMDDGMDAQVDLPEKGGSGPHDGDAGATQDAGMSNDAGASHDAGTADDAGASDDAGTEGGVAALCLRDQDGDGFGVAGHFEPCRTDAEEVLPGDCDDQDPSSYPGAPRIACDGVDNDCDGNAVETSEEICNGLDDDCDGVVDPNLTTRLEQDGFAVHVQPQDPLENPPSQAHVALLARPSGGAWLLYRGQRSASDVGTFIMARGLDEQGQGDTANATRQIVPGASRFVAVANGLRLGVVARVRPRPDETMNDSVGLRLVVFDANNFSVIAERVIEESLDADLRVDSDDPDDCNDLEPLDVAALKDPQGTYWFAVAYLQNKGAMRPGASACSVESKTVHLAFFSLTGTTIHLNNSVTLEDHERLVLERVPCRYEWLVISGPVTGGVAPQRFALSGKKLDVTLEGLDLSSTVQGLTALEHACDGSTPQLAVAEKNHLYRYWVDPASGSFSLAESPVIVSDWGWPARLAYAGGRWFGAGYQVPPLSGNGYVPRLFEVAYLPTGPTVRELPLFDKVYPGGYFPSQQRVGLVALESGVTVAAYANLRVQSSLNNYRPPGVTDPAVAVTYRVGCSE